MRKADCWHPFEKRDREVARTRRRGRLRYHAGERPALRVTPSESDQRLGALLPDTLAKTFGIEL